jgi:hypothetical protein
MRCRARVLGQGGGELVDRLLSSHKAQRCSGATDRRTSLTSLGVGQPLPGVNHRARRLIILARQIAVIATA